MLSGKIRIERVVGQGSMGIVLEATDLPLQRRVAVKLMAPERAHNEESRKRFIREARAAVRLSSEHVTRLIDVGELDDGTPYLVMEYLVGSTLEHVLLTEGPPPIDVAVDWILQALDGVAEAHRAGFVHRDLKPENLFLCERPDRPPIVKVLDFGTVKDLVSKATKLTRTGATMGSPAYMPPEQVRADEIDQRADVWAIGVTLYELITGRLPFGGESVPQTLAAILRDHHIPLRHHRPDAPADLEALIACSFSKDPAGRYASGNEMLAALSMVRRKLPSTTRVTKTIRLDNISLSRGEEYGETTDMHRIPESDRGTEASAIRPRVLVNDVPSPSSPQPSFIDHDPDGSKRTLVVQERQRSISLVMIVVIAITLAIALGGGAALLYRYLQPRVTQTSSSPTVATAIATTAPVPTLNASSSSSSSSSSVASAAASSAKPAKKK